METARLAGKDPAGATLMTVGTEQKLARERAGLSTEQDNVLNSFAAEKDLTAPPAATHATHTPLNREIPFIFERAPMPLAPVPAPRGRARRALTLLALLGAAGWGAYVYESSPPLDLDIIAMLAPRSSSPTDTAPTATATAPSEAPPNDAPPNDPPLASNESAAAPEADRKPDTGGSASATASEITRPIPARPQSVATSSSLAGPIQNVSGQWRLDTLVETSDSSFEELKLHYEMKLAQDGDRVTGFGTKISENEGIGPRTHTPVTVTGTIAGGRLTMNFVERGTPPGTRSRFVLLVDEAGTFRGRFSSSAAPSSGHVEAHRVSPAQ